MQKNSIIYILKRSGGQIVKIGETSHNAQKRFEDYAQIYFLEGFSIHKTYDVRSSKRKLIEKTVHEKLKPLRISGISGARELFECTPERAEQVVEETIKELQPSLFLDLFEKNKLNINDPFFEIKIILEFLELSNLSIYEFCKEIIFKSNPDEREPRYYYFWDYYLGLPLNHIQDWHKNLPIPDKIINKNSNPNLSEIIEEYISNKNFIDLNDFTQNLIKKIYRKFSHLKRLEKISMEKKPKITLDNESYKNIQSNLLSQRNHFKEIKEKIVKQKLILKKRDFSSEDEFDDNINQIHKLEKEFSKISRSISNLEQVHKQNQIERSKLEEFNIKENKIKTKTINKTQKMIISMQIVLDFREKVSFKKLNNFKFKKEFIISFFNEFSKLNTNERSLIMCKIQFLECFMYDLYLPLDQKQNRSLISKYIVENNLQVFLKNLIKKYINNHVKSLRERNQAYRAHEKQVLKDREDKIKRREEHLKRKEKHRKAEKLAEKKRIDWEAMSEEEKLIITSDIDKRRYYKKFVKKWQN